MKKKKIFFISGHRDITDNEFSVIYKPEIDKAIEEFDASFFIGDYEGVDIMSQNYLIDELNYDVNKIIVCHIGNTPMNINQKVRNTIAKFNDDIHRDSFMTINSDADIAFVREGKETSGTAQNIIRRVTFTTTSNVIKKIKN